MKKTLVALAALAATSAFAQSSVSITGLIDTGYQSKTAADNAKTQGVAANGTGTTVLTFAGTEDLGAGLKANFQFQLTPDFVNGAGVQGTTWKNDAGIGNGQQAFVGLSGGFGEVQAGRVNSNALDAWGVGSVFGTALGSGYGSNGNLYTRYSVTATSTSQTAPTRFNGAVRYISPAFNGFTASALVVPKGASTATQSVSDYGIKYSNGPLNVAFAQQTIKQFGDQGNYSGFIPVADTTDALADGKSNKLTALSANYTIGAVTVYGATWNENYETATAVKTTGRMIGAKYVMGAVSLLASTGTSNETTAANVDKKITGLGADYALSKRTNLYVRYENRDANTNSATANTANGSTKTTQVGVKHTF